MSFTFYQSTGKLCDDKSGQCSSGYSGFKGETNQTKHNSGPIPQGSYTIDNSCAGKGERCNLKPDSSNEMYGRSNFQIHGDNSKGDQSASHGCIILNQNDRANFSAGDRLTVKK